jgi:UDP-4-amino-4,6-dideoxy-L-N-acetyl-beta-L-altrosamine transaminase
MIRYGKHFIDKHDIKEVKKSLNGRFLTSGVYLNKFEASLSNYFGSRYTLVTSNGTTALHLAGKVLKWNDKTNVITTTNTFVATANAAIYNNSKIHLIDIDPNTYNIDLNILEKKIKKIRNNHNGSICVVGVDFAGYPCNWKDLRYLANKYKCNLINDNCHALGAKYENSKKYAIKYADIVTQSFHPVKNFTSGEGGALLTNNYEYYQYAKKIRSHGIYFQNKKKLSWQYNIDSIGFNYRLSELNCALGYSQLKKLDKFVEKRNYLAKTYFNELKDIKFLKLPQIFYNNDKSITHAFHLFKILIDFKKIKLNKTELYNYFYKNNIILQTHYVPIYKLKIYKRFFKNIKFPNTEKYYNSEFSLPIFYTLKNKTIKKISALLKKIEK